MNEDEGGIYAAFVSWRIDRTPPRALNGSFLPMPIDPALHWSVINAV